MVQVTPILIHFAGYWFVNLLMPSWVEEAGNYYLTYWYMCFALIDLIALNFCYSRVVQILLSLSASWSVCLVLEMQFIQDDLQRFDWLAQNFIDSCLVLVAVYFLIGRGVKFLVKRKGKGLGA